MLSDVQEEVWASCNELACGLTRPLLNQLYFNAVRLESPTFG